MIRFLFEMTRPSNIYCSVHSLRKLVFKIVFNKMGQTSFKCTAAREWKFLLPKDIREIQSLSKFKAIVFEYVLNLIIYAV